ncbi:hypothetical protein BJ508DRAFT_332519 [Ascobolus immersus RN42]|uniref:Uncharacterized protein n=1 Tax=Ascobolus immersus RN42 TaxID=1160509 RepID=A0A3N4HT69_ASCIM|nr:hypothetical protein BJ508DRAFT_332519 [Ascobolus immersus RN42]
MEWLEPAQYFSPALAVPDASDIPGPQHNFEIARHHARRRVDLRTLPRALAAKRAPGAGCIRKRSSSILTAAAASAAVSAPTPSRERAPIIPHGLSRKLDYDIYNPLEIESVLVAWRHIETPARLDIMLDVDALNILQQLYLLARSPDWMPPPLAGVPTSTKTQAFILREISVVAGLCQRLHPERKEDFSQRRLPTGVGLRQYLWKMMLLPSTAVPTYIQREKRTFRSLVEKIRRIPGFLRDFWRATKTFIPERKPPTSEQPTESEEVIAYDVALRNMTDHERARVVVSNAFLVHGAHGPLEFTRLF